MKWAQLCDNYCYYTHLRANVSCNNTYKMYYVMYVVCLKKERKKHPLNLCWLSEMRLHDLSALFPTYIDWIELSWAKLRWVDLYQVDRLWFVQLHSSNLWVYKSSASWIDVRIFCKYAYTYAWYSESFHLICCYKCYFTALANSFLGKYVPKLN